MLIYLIGSLRNPELPIVGDHLRDYGYDVFDDWHSGGEKADDAWQGYEQGRGRSYAEALQGRSAKHCFGYDMEWLAKADAVILVMPAGKSGHLELGWAIGQGKKGYILFDKEPERWDMMYQMATEVFFELSTLLTSFPDCRLIRPSEKVPLSREACSITSRLLF